MTLLRCPVVGCGRWSNRWKGTPRLLPPSFTLPLDPSINTDVNGRVCPACYVRHIRLAHQATATSTASPHCSLEELARVAVAESDSTPPSLLLPSTTSSSPPSVPSPPLSSSPQPLSDITNTPLKERRHSTPLKRKRELVEAAAALSSPEQRKLFYARERVDGRVLRRWVRTVGEHEQRLKPKQLQQLLREGVTTDESPTKKRRPMTAKRLSGGGRKPALTAEQEAWLRDRVLSLRRCDHHFAVAEIHI